ncbi:MAG: glucose-6-phosphate isomerase [Bacilli bacterium]|nr:glucose-6-phosphate isomerase [Bacilli bacterium]
MIKVDVSHLNSKINFAAYADRVKEINDGINERTGLGNDFLGWAKYPETYDKEEFAKIQEAAKYIRANYKILVVCGIGGSYLGARAAIEAITGLYAKSKVKIIYMGQTFDPEYVSQVMRFLKGKKFAINVISKSGTTTETAIAFRMLRDLLVSQVGKEEAAKAIFATTDANKGALLELCKKYGYTRFVLPADVGGRYSVFTAVGVLPMAVAGIDIQAFMNGAGKAMVEYSTGDIKTNQCYRYAVARHQLYKDGKAVELFVTYRPQYVQLGEWWKQLFGESEGKEGTGLLPDSATFSTDLHSLGQFIQEGSHILFETVLNVKACKKVAIPHDDDNLDGLNYLDGKTLGEVCSKAFQGTLDAHANVGSVPNIVLNIKKMDAEGLGFLMYFFMRACAMSAYLNEINPFDQPGVEIYKKNMFHLLGKPGY